MAIYCIESTIDLQIGDYGVRMWIDKPEIPKDHREDQEVMKRLLKLTYKPITERKLLDWCMANVPNLNAVQVRNGAVGTVLYTKAFTDGEDDPHG